MESNHPFQNLYKNITIGSNTNYYYSLKELNDQRVGNL